MAGTTVAAPGHSAPTTSRAGAPDGRHRRRCVPEDRPTGGRRAHEADVLELAAGGAPVDEIAARAFLSPGTVRTHLSAAAVELGAPNRHAAVALARRHGWI